MKEPYSINNAKQGDLLLPDFNNGVIEGSHVFLLFNGLMFSNLLVHDARVEKVKERRKDSE